jgi:hypothetical protein
MRQRESHGNLDAIFLLCDFRGFKPTKLQNPDPDPAPRKGQYQSKIGQFWRSRSQSQWSHQIAILHTCSAEQDRKSV